MCGGEGDVEGVEAGGGGVGLRVVVVVSVDGDGAGGGGREGEVGEGVFEGGFDEGVFGFTGFALGGCWAAAGEREGTRGFG